MEMAKKGIGATPPLLSAKRYSMTKVQEETDLDGSSTNGHNFSKLKSLNHQRNSNTENQEHTARDSASIGKVKLIATFKD